MFTLNTAQKSFTIYIETFRNSNFISLENTTYIFRNITIINNNKLEKKNIVLFTIIIQNKLIYRPDFIKKVNFI